MRLEAPIYQLKRQAKLLAREMGTALHDALDQIALANGFRRWNQLVAAQTVTPAKMVFDALQSGDLLLLGARPGHGKTLLGLELAAIAAKRGLESWFFSLEETTESVQRRLKELGIGAPFETNPVSIDTSNEISGEYIIDRIKPTTTDSFIVIDYLQVLDHQRTRPDLETQVSALRKFAKSTGTVIVAISQIDRRFELSTTRLPNMTDIRLPNPLNIALFDKICFLHQGQLRVQSVA